MDAIGDDYVEKNFKNEGFVKFIFDNARMVTHTHTQSLEQIKDDPENWFAKLHPSDKAYAVTQRVNNERVWAWTYEKKKGRTKIRVQTNRPTSQERRGRNLHKR